MIRVFRFQWTLSQAILSRIFANLASDIVVEWIGLILKFESFEEVSLRTQIVSTVHWLNATERNCDFYDGEVPSKSSIFIVDLTDHGVMPSPLLILFMTYLYDVTVIWWRILVIEKVLVHSHPHFVQPHSYISVTSGILHVEHNHANPWSWFCAVLRTTFFCFEVPFEKTVIVIFSSQMPIRWLRCHKREWYCDREIWNLKEAE
jgi:hypothetical protein